MEVLEEGVLPNGVQVWGGGEEEVLPDIVRDLEIDTDFGEWMGMPCLLLFWLLKSDFAVDRCYW